MSRCEGVKVCARDAVLTRTRDPRAREHRISNGASAPCPQSDGTIVDTSSIPSLEITVVDRQVTPRRSDHEFPTYGVATRRPWTEEQ